MDQSRHRKPTVLVYDQLDYLDWSYDIERSILEPAGVSLTVPPRADGRSLLRTADVVIVHDGPFGPDEMARLREPAGIVCYSVGYDRVDLAAAAAAGIEVRNLPEWAAQVVAEHTLTLALAAVRRLPAMERSARSPRWRDRRLVEGLGIELFSELTVGIIGAGRIGRVFAEKARALGFRTLATTPRAPGGTAELPIVPLRELLGSADVVVILAPLNADTRGLFDDDAFETMRPGSVLVNTSRGGIVDEQALAAALDRGRIAIAALDVRSQEPPSEHDPLRGRADVILTPHAAWVAASAVRAYHTEAATTALALLEAAGRIRSGEPPT